MKKQRTKTSLMKEADRLYSEYWRKEIKKCENCGNRETLQLCHIISRNCRKLRYERKNTLVLCAGCHFGFHHNPLTFVNFVNYKKGKNTYNWVLKQSNELKPITKEDYEFIIKKYKILNEN